MDIPGFYSGCVAGIFCVAQNLALASLAYDCFLFFLWLVEPLLSLFGLVLHPPRLFPCGSYGSLSTRGAESGYYRAVDTAAVSGSVSEGLVYSLGRYDNLFAGYGSPWPKNSATGNGCIDFNRPADGAGGVIQQQTDLAAHQSCK